MGSVFNFSKYMKWIRTLCSVLKFLVLLVCRLKKGKFYVFDIFNFKYQHHDFFMCGKLRITGIEWFYISVLATSLDSSLSLGSGSSANLLSTALCEKENKIDYNGLDFRIILDSKSGSGPPMTVILVASTLQEKAAWCSDIGQVSTFALYNDYHSL